MRMRMHDRTANRELASEETTAVQLDGHTVTAADEASAVVQVKFKCTGKDEVMPQLQGSTAMGSGGCSSKQQQPRGGI